MKKTLSVVIGFGLSFLFLFLAAKQVDLAGVASAYAGAKLAYLPLLVLLVCVDLAIRGYRWKLLVSPAKNICTWQMIKLETTGLALNNVLPLRLGEIARASLGASLFGVPLFTLLATILVERILDMISLAAIFIVGARYSGAIPQAERYGATVWIILAIIAAGLLSLIFLEHILERSAALQKILERFPRIGKIIRQIAVGAHALREPNKAVTIVALGIALWVVNALGYYFGGAMMSLSPRPGIGKSFVLLSAGALSVMLPAMPGYFGAFELAIQQVLSSWGIDKNIGLAYATLLHINTYSVMTLLGLIFLYQTGHSLSGIWNTLAKRSEPAK